MPQRNRHRERLRSGAAEAPVAPGSAATASAAPVLPPSGVVHISSPDDAVQLAERLLSTGRSWPVAVVTIATGNQAPFIDADVLKAEVGDLGEVVVMPTSGVSWAFSEAMPSQTQVYGGAGRVYDVDHAWVSNPYASTLRFAYTEADSRRVVPHLVSDMMAAALRAGLLRGAEPQATPPCSGVVQGLIGERAIVQLDDGGRAAIWAELTVAGVSLDRLVRAGQRVTGPLEPESRRLDIRPAIISSEHVLSEYAAGDVILVDVLSADAGSVTVRPHPEVSVSVPAAFVTDNPLDLVDELFTAGEVILARVVTAGAALQLRLDDIDDDTHVPAPALLPGGPPWLTLPAARAPAPADAPPLAGSLPLPDAAPPAGDAQAAGDAQTARLPHGPADPHARAPQQPVGPAPAPAPATIQDGALGDFHELLSLRSLTRRQEDELARARAQIASLTTRYRMAEDTRRTLQKKLKAAGTVANEHDVSGLFVDPEDQFRFEVCLAWAQRIPAEQKDELPLPAYVVGPKFLASLAETEGISRTKVLDVVVDVLTGLARTSRAPHMLRINATGGSPPRTREDGAVCWRVALQQNTPSARRLHYWSVGDTIELSRVVTHDDTEP